MYKFTDKSTEIRNVNINLRYESDLLTDEFGIDILYIRNCKFVRCKCFDDLNQNGDPDCPLCFGSGHFASIEKINVIQSSNQAYRFENYIALSGTGISDQKNEIYYIRYPFIPKTRDFIVKVTWDKYKNPIDIVQVLEIINVYEMRGDNGRVELNGCQTEDRTDLVIPFTNVLKSLPRKVLTPLTKGGKSIWPSKILTYTTKQDKK